MRLPSPRLAPAFAGLALAVACSAQQAGFSLPLFRVPIRLGQAQNNIPLINSQQYTYIVRAIVGGQVFSFVMDTGSSDLWVVSDNCSDEDCQAVSRFSPSRSDTLVQTGMPFRLDYLMGSVHGQMVFDTVRMGPYEVESQIFAMVSRTADIGLASTDTSGILGLCFPASAAIPATAGATFLENIMSLFDPPQRFFAFHLPRMPGSTDPNASFTMGSLDPDLAPEPDRIAYSPVVRTGRVYDYWKIPILRLTLNGVAFPLSVSRVPSADTPIAVLDSGTTLLLGPSADVAALYALLGSAARPAPPSLAPRSDNDPVTYQILCTHAALLGLVLGNPPHEYPIHPSDFAWAEGADGGWCTGGVQANDGVNGGDWLLGDIFLRNVYAVHHTNPPCVGLLNLIDPETAVAQFRSERGPDVDDNSGGNSDDADVAGKDGDGWDTATGYVKRWEHSTGGAAGIGFGAIAGGIGFVVGGAGAVSWRMWRGV
ncbi:acid protease [Mycena crocata]|nr:acid protease [Mycena crocata]